MMVNDLLNVLRSRVVKELCHSKIELRFHLSLLCCRTDRSVAPPTAYHPSSPTLTKSEDEYKPDSDASVEAGSLSASVMDTAPSDADKATTIDIESTTDTTVVTAAENVVENALPDAASSQESPTAAPGDDGPVSQEGQGDSDLLTEGNGLLLNPASLDPLRQQGMDRDTDSTIGVAIANNEGNVSMITDQSESGSHATSSAVSSSWVTESMEEAGENSFTLLPSPGSFQYYLPSNAHTQAAHTVGNSSFYYVFPKGVYASSPTRSPGSSNGRGLPSKPIQLRGAVQLQDRPALLELLKG